MSNEISTVKMIQTNVGAKKVSGDNSELSQETKMKLEALGIDVPAGITEAEAQQMIKDMEEENFYPQDPTKSEIANDIKSLAATVGLSYDSTDAPDEILNAIAEELEAQIDEAENNPQALSTLMGYFHKLSDLDAQLDEIKNAEAQLFSAMDLIANKNKKAFGF